MWLGLYGMFRTKGERLSTQFVDQALTSGEFLEYDFKSNSYAIGPCHKALFSLKESVERLKGFSNGTFDEQIMTLIDRYSPKNNPGIQSDKERTVSNMEITAAIACNDYEQNVADLCVSLLKAFDGDLTHLTNLKLRAPTPDEKMA